MARTASPADVLAILAAGDFDPLLGIIEDERVEFKEQPYHLANDERRMELAKDVSALANVDEGVIVLGPRTGQPDASRPQDEVVAISPFAAALVDVEQYERWRRWCSPRWRTSIFGGIHQQQTSREVSWRLL